LLAGAEFQEWQEGNGRANQKMVVFRLRWLGGVRRATRSSSHADRLLGHGKKFDEA